MKYLRLPCIILMFTWLTVATSSASDALSKEEHRQVISDHLKTLDYNTPEFSHTVGVILLDQNGPRANIESIPGGAALGLAASYYAVATLDFDVSVRDVLDYGLWPYATIPMDVNIDHKLYDFPEMEVMNNGDLDVDGDYGSAQWRIVAKQQVLHYFYEDYFVRNYRFRNIMSSSGTVANWSEETSSAQQTIIRDSGYPLDYALDCLPEADCDFWYNDIECRPMCVNPQVVGDTSCTNISSVLHLEDRLDPQLQIDIKVLDINIH